MKPRCTVIISKRPLLCEGLGCLIDEMLKTAIIKAPDEETAEHLCAGFTPDLIIIDRPKAQAYEQMCSFWASNSEATVILLGWENDEFAVFSCERVMPATLKNLAKSVKESLAKTSLYER
jgi:DNA-binding NarL/FixJ family response regulator